MHSEPGGSAAGAGGGRRPEEPAGEAVRRRCFLKTFLPVSCVAGILRPVLGKSLIWQGNSMFYAVDNFLPFGQQPGHSRTAAGLVGHPPVGVHRLKALFGHSPGAEFASSDRFVHSLFRFGHSPGSGFPSGHSSALTPCCPNATIRTSLEPVRGHLSEVAR